MAVDSILGGAGIFPSAATGDVSIDFDAPADLSFPGGPTLVNNVSTLLPPASQRIASVAYVRAVAPIAGGAINQVLAKNSATNFDYKWVNQSGGPGGPVAAEDVSVAAATLIPVAIVDVQAALEDIYDRGVFIVNGGGVPGPGPGGSWPDGPIVTSDGTDLGSLAIGTGLAISGTFPDQTLEATGGGGPSVDTVAVVSAAGTDQDSAFELGAVFNVVGVVNDGEGVRLPGGLATGSGNCYVRNSGDNVLQVYPPTGGVLNKQAANASITVPPDTTGFFKSTSATQWYTVP